ncbi:hypothetical protein [Nocardia sp. NPDC051832]|uniref:hypothetical protein n=1 Tax=Nocardia sp. NPDC051832 TaxID=3155673 RepID=UPI0034457721
MVESSGPGDVTQPSDRPGGDSGPPTLDRVVAEHGPMPESMVRGIGVRLAEALAAMHALRQVFGDLRRETVLVDADGARLGRAQLPAGRQVSAADDVYALGGVLVFAATGRTPFQEQGLDALPPGLRTVLRDCLSDDPSRRPRADELARALADTPAQTTRLAPPPFPGDAQATQRLLPEVPAVPPQYDAAQPDSRTRLPWIIAAVCGLLVVIILATVGVVAATRDNDDAQAAAAPSAGLSGKADPAKKYTAASLGDACALLDLPAAEKVIGKQSGTPLGDKIELPSIADTLSCNTMNDHGFIMLHIEVSDQMTMVRQLYDLHRATGLGTTGSGVTAKTVSGIGDDAYLVVHEPNNGNSQQISCQLGFLQANVIAIVNLYLSEDDGSTRDKLTEYCQHQARTVLGRLK